MSLVLFANRLKELRLKAGLKAEDFSQFGISRRMIFSYEAAQSSPTLEKLVALANVFGVSLDYLCGRTDNPQRKIFEELSNLHETSTPSDKSSITDKKGKKVL